MLSIIDLVVSAGALNVRPVASLPSQPLVTAKTHKHAAQRDSNHKISGMLDGPSCLYIPSDPQLSL